RRRVHHSGAAGRRSGVRSRRWRAVSRRTTMANLDELAQAHLAEASTEERGRSAELVAHDGPLRQTVIALKEGVRMAEHNSPPAASLQVLTGRVRVRSEEHT